MTFSVKKSYFIRVLVDMVLIAYCFTMSVLTQANVNRLGANFFILSLGAMLLFWYLATKFTALYREARIMGFAYEIANLIKATFIFSIVVIISFFFFKHDVFSRSFVIIFLVTTFISLGTEKFVVRQLIRYIRKRGRSAHKFIIVGAGKVGMRFREIMHINPQFGYSFGGYVDDDYKSHHDDFLGHIDDIESILRTEKPNEVVIALPNRAYTRINELIHTCEKYPVGIKVIPDYSGLLTHRFSLSTIENLPIISVHEDKLNYFHYRLLKRAFDVSVTMFVIFPFLLPVIGVIAILQKIFNPGPVFYKSERWGRGGLAFACYKFRSMKPHKAPVNRDTYENTSPEDDRITPLGKILRKYNLDELPQFFNVLLGDMSLVGPRPHDAIENERLSDKIDLYLRRHIIRPGITGWAQVNGFRGGTNDITRMQKRIDHDIWYIENWSTLLDIQIMIMTAWRMVKGDPGAY